MNNCERCSALIYNTNHRLNAKHTCGGLRMADLKAGDSFQLIDGRTSEVFKIEKMEYSSLNYIRMTPESGPNLIILKAAKVLLIKPDKDHDKN